LAFFYIFSFVLVCPTFILLGITYLYGKKQMLRFIKRVVVTLGVLYVLLCIGMYFFQEKLMFKPIVLSETFSFDFKRSFKEVKIPVDSDVNLHALVFRADSAKGIIVYNHGNSGSVRGYGDFAEIYNPLGYDFLVYDYRGYGKSEGAIESQEQFYSDAQVVYDFVKKEFADSQIVVIGYSIGTAPAAYLAGNNKPKHTILLAPFYSMLDMMDRNYPYVPSFLLNYPLESHKLVDKASSPVVIFHGTSDETIPLASAEKFKKHLKSKDQFFILQGQAHKNVDRNESYLKILKGLLAK
jgi:alpha-beta hydrolase superfamily lysophospholipase